MKFIVLLALCLLPITAQAQTKFMYQGQQMQSSDHRLYVNADKASKPSRYTFRTVNEALLYAEKLTADTLWTEIYIEPSVYWIDDPDDPAIRRTESGTGTPFGLEVKLSRTRIIGLSEDPKDIILACNRGQTQGAEGNFTMLHIVGDDIEVRNLTFGNYCNVDLDYPRNPKLNRAKRKSAIVQAQLIICQGERYRADNCHFISRLNLCPFAGARYVDFNDCYFECTDDALCGTATYQHCRFTLFSSKPFYSTYAEGATFIDCDIHSKVQGTQFLTKVSGPVKMERCRWTSEDPNLKIEWNKRPDPRHFCVMTDCTLNGKPLDVPTPTEPLPVVLPPFGIAVQPEIIPGRWTLDCYKPADTQAYNWQPDPARSAWGYAEGIDGAEGSWGLVQIQRGARMMFTPKETDTTRTKQTCTITMDPCKGPGQGFGSATGQYMDICIKFDTRTLTGYGLRFIRTPEYDKAVEVYLVEYDHAVIRRISEPQRCDLFRPGCAVTLCAEGNILSAEIRNDRFESLSPQLLSATMEKPNSHFGFHLQHTGSTGASATVIKTISLK